MKRLLLFMKQGFVRKTSPYHPAHTCQILRRNVHCVHPLVM